MADDVGAECFKEYGGLDYQTPFINRLAETGKLFKNCYSQPLCTPSRVQLMTGLYNNRNYKGFGYLDPNEITFANVLKGAGYSTCISGKWQLGGNEDTIKGFGFDQHCLWNMHTYQELDKNGLPNPENWLKRYDDPTLFKNGSWYKPGANNFGPDICTDFICDFIEESKEPFFVYYPMILPHSPFVPTPASKGRNQTKKQNFIDMVEYIDKLVGRIIDTLDKVDKRSNTVIIFTYDNGTHTKLRSKTKKGIIQGAKASMINAGTHVPLIVNWPGVVQVGNTNALTDFSDILPTIVEIAGAKLHKSINTDGTSLLPILTGNSLEHRKSILLLLGLWA